MEKMCRIPLPCGAEEGIRRLECAGYGTYAVGGCVRDAVLGIMPHDFDLCTAAKPQEICRVFDGEHLSLAGVRHGTVGVILAGEPLEITTFRTDGSYSDGRHPDSVTFTDRLEDDLRRRDFTVNAMAYHPARGLVDLFGGCRDISDRMIRCVGAPEQRFSEDALRILRALRFSAVLGFRIEEKTEEALFREAYRLSAVASERICAELRGLLRGAKAAETVRRYALVLSVLFPKLAETLETETGRRALCVLDGASCTERVKLAWFALLAEGADAGRIPEFACQLRLPAETASDLSVLTSSGTVPDTLPALRRFLHAAGCGDKAITITEEMLSAEEIQGREVSAVRRLLERVRREKLCFERNGAYGLALSGAELLRAGLASGRGIGALLDLLLSLVVEEKLPNERGALFTAALQYAKSLHG